MCLLYFQESEKWKGTLFLLQVYICKIKPYDFIISNINSKILFIVSIEYNFGIFIYIEIIYFVIWNIISI